MRKKWQIVELCDGEIRGELEESHFKYKLQFKIKDYQAIFPSRVYEIREAEEVERCITSEPDNDYNWLDVPTIAESYLDINGGRNAQQVEDGVEVRTVTGGIEPPLVGDYSAVRRIEHAVSQEQIIEENLGCDNRNQRSGWGITGGINRGI